MEPEKYVRNQLVNDLLELSINEFEKSINLFEEDIFLRACQNDDYDKIRFLINIDFGLNFISDARTTGFTFLCYNGDKPNINYLLDKNILPKSFYYIRDNKGNLPFDYLKNSEYIRYPERNQIRMSSNQINSDIKNRIDMMSTSDDIFNNNFKLYKFEDFDIINYEKDFKGAYGKVIHGINKETGQDMIIKKYIECQRFGIFESTIKEIAFLRHINKLNPQIAVILYGVIYEDSCVYLVQEYMTHTLKEEFSILSENANKNKYIVELMYELILLINSLNGLGFSHNDLKFDNIMFSLDGKMKLIDFGISDYLGLFPTRNMAQNFLASEIFKAPDTLDLTVKSATDDMLVQSYTRSFTTEMFHLGSVVLMKLLNFEEGKYFYDNNKLFRKNYYTSNKNTDVYEVIDAPHDSLHDFCYKCIQFYPENRYYAKDALNDELFTGIPYKVTTTLKSLGPFSTKIASTYYNNLERELYYKEEIFKSVLFLKFIEVPEKIDMELFCIATSVLIDITRILALSFNTCFNAIIHLRAIIETVPKNKYKGYACACLKFYSNIFDYEILEEKHFVKLTNGEYSIEEINKLCYEVANLEIIPTTNPFNFVPVITYIGYIIEKLQELRIMSGEITEVFENLMSSMIMYVIFNDKSQLYVWDVVRYNYYIYKNNLPDLNILGDIDSDKLEHIKYCNSCSYGLMNYEYILKKIKNIL